MERSFLFFSNSILLGVGLAMDAFSVSLANGLRENQMKVHRMCGISGVYAFFQFLMPMIGWVCVHTVVQALAVFEKLIHWIALALLLYIGGKMLLEALRGSEEEEETVKLSFTTLLMQGIATAIDALSVGFTIADYDVVMALVCAIIIAIVTFCICFVGLAIGKRFGTKLSNKAGILGGMILVFIGLEIFIKCVFFE